MRNLSCFAICSCRRRGCWSARNSVVLQSKFSFFLSCLPARVVNGSNITIISDISIDSSDIASTAIDGVDGIDDIDDIMVLMILRMVFIVEHSYSEGA